MWKKQVCFQNYQPVNSSVSISGMLTSTALIIFSGTCRTLMSNSFKRLSFDNSKEFRLRISMPFPCHHGLQMFAFFSVASRCPCCFTHGSVRVQCQTQEFGDWCLNDCDNSDRKHIVYSQSWNCCVLGHLFHMLSVI